MMQEFGYSANDILQEAQVKAYMMVYDKEQGGNILQEAAFDQYGMMMLTFDEEIAKINHISNEFANAIMNESNEPD